MSKRRRGRRGRRNPGLGELMVFNRPRRARRHSLTLHGRRISKRSRLARRHRGMVLNPVRALGLGMFSPPMSAGTITQVVATGAGFIAVRMLPKYLPLNWQTGTLGIAGKVGTVLVTTAVAGMVTRNQEIRKAVFVGGLLSIAVDLLAQALPGVDLGRMNMVVPGNISMPIPSNSVGADLPVPSASIPVVKEEESW